MNKKELLETIVNNYDNICDVEYEPKNNDTDEFFQNGETENQLMDELWTQFIDHLYVKDHMFFQMAIVQNEHVYLIFIDVLDGHNDDLDSTDYIDVPLIKLTPDLTPEDLRQIKIDTLKQLEV